MVLSIQMYMKTSWIVLFWWTPFLVSGYGGFLPRLTKSYGSLMHDMEAKQVDTLFINKQLTQVFVKEGELEFVSDIHPLLVGPLVDKATRNGVDMILQDPTPFNGWLQEAGSIASSAFQLTLFTSLFITLFRMFGKGPTGGMSNGFMGLPNMRAGQTLERNKGGSPNVTFADWAGSPEVLRECTEIVSFVRNASLYEAVGAEVPRGILLEGPPGTGKTLIAKAIATEANASFVSLSASEFVEMYVGLGALKVRNLFAEARALKPCIVFIDEIDAVGRKRGSGSMPGSNDEREQTLNQLLYEMDGFQSNEGVFVLAATNRRDILDAALLRPGRFDRIVNVPLPDRASRRLIFRRYLQEKKSFSDLFLQGTKLLDVLAEETDGLSGAQIKNVVNEAAILAARQGRSALLPTDLEKALEKALVGVVKEQDERGTAVLERVAIHEIGHAFLAALFPKYFELKKTTLDSTYGGAGGYTLFGTKPEWTEGGLYTRDLLQKRLVVLLGGKAAETVFYGFDHVSVGASQDLKQANALARQMVETFGMGPSLETFSSGGDEIRQSEATKEQVDREVQMLVQLSYEEAVERLQLFKEKWVNLAVKLQEERMLTGDVVYGAL